MTKLTWRDDPEYLALVSDLFLSVESLFDLNSIKT